jgi:hypothetical protein
MFKLFVWNAAFGKINEIWLAVHKDATSIETTRAYILEWQDVEELEEWGLAGETTELGENLSHYHCAHQKFHMT